MMNIFIPDKKYFSLKELFPPDIYRSLESQNKLLICWRFLNPRMLWTLVEIRKFYNLPVYVNDWDSGGSLKYRCLRPFNCSEGSEWSGHKFGNCVDFTIKNLSSDEIRQHIKVNRFKLEMYQYITTLEDFEGMNWVHIGFENAVSQNGFLIFDNK